MTEVVQSSPPSSIQCSPTTNDGLYQHTRLNPTLIINNNPTTTSPPVDLDLFEDQLDTNTEEEEEEEVGGGGERKRRREEEEDQLNLVGLFFTAFRRSVFGCSSCESITSSSSSSSCSSGMEIGLPTNVRHVAHVTFDRFNGFLGLPVEFEPEVPRRAPSASATVFGVSTNSMQLSFDTRGNSVPTILLLMQHRLYAIGGLQAEGIFRINADNGQEEYVREQLNRGLIPDDVDVHCLAGLIKAWFRELPTGVLDCLSPEDVMQSQTEEECAQLARLLPPTEAALLDWAINLMADVAHFEHLNKMNARNVAMVFAPNMTHMADPLTALMHAVQVMNFLKTLIERTLRERQDSTLDSPPDSSTKDHPSGGNDHHSSLQTIHEESNEPDEEDDDPYSKTVNPHSTTDDHSQLNQDDESTQGDHDHGLRTKSDGVKPSSYPKSRKSGQSSTAKKGPRKTSERLVVQVAKPAVKTTKGTSLVSSVNPRTERVEAWR